MRRLSLMLLANLAGALILSGCSQSGRQGSDSLAGYQPNYSRGMHIYRAFCAECHDNGRNGAPMLDDPEEWDTRAVGFTGLLERHAIKGFLGMPEKGAHPELTQRNVADAVHYMVREIVSHEDDE